jgi:hypothetical protein
MRFDHRDHHVDSGALALGAEKVAKTIRAELAERGIEAKIVRNGSRGAYFLEPMIEVATANGRVAYGPVKPSDVKSLFDSGFLTGGHHKRWLGAPDKIPFLAKQTRLTFARCGVIDPLSLDSYKAHGGLKGLQNAVAAKVKQLLGIGFHETTLDGSVTLEPVYCLGLCACSPSAMLDGEVIGRLDDEKIEEIVAEVRS